MRLPRRSSPNDITVEDEIAAPEKAGLAMTDKVIEKRYPFVSGVEILAMTAKAQFVIASEARQSCFMGLLQEPS